MRIFESRGNLYVVNYDSVVSSSVKFWFIVSVFGFVIVFRFFDCDFNCVILSSY